MKRLILLTILIFSQLACAQALRLSYNLKYKVDSTATDFKILKTVLDIHEGHTLYFEERAIATDSLNKSKPLTTSTYTSPIAKLKRKTGDFVNMNYYRSSMDYFKFKTQDKIDWKFLPDTKQHGEWLVQKATCNFGGRTWEAWFAKDFPFNEGPYKFTGLPGIITEIRDTKNNYSWELESVKKPGNFNPNLLETVFKQPPLEITESKYKEILLNDYRDPFVRFKILGEGNWIFETKDGKEVSTNEELKRMTPETQAEIRKNYNPIELDKAVDYEGITKKPARKPMRK